jgi:hypothetical protein
VVVPEGAPHVAHFSCTCHRKESPAVAESEESEESEDQVPLLVNLLKRVRTLEERLATFEEERASKKQKKEH